MPQTYEITAPNGKTLSITGDHVPNEAELHQIFAAAGVSTGAAPPTADDGWTAKFPKTAGVVRAGLDALPGIGGVAGLALAGPESAGLAAVPAVALGAGAGRGLRDLIAEGIGLDKPSSPAAKGGRIALDSAESAAAQTLLPGLLEAIKTPGKTVGEVMELLPARFRPTMPKGLERAPAAILQRPAWQTWGDYMTPSPGTMSADEEASLLKKGFTPQAIEKLRAQMATPPPTASSAPVVAPGAAAPAAPAPVVAAPAPAAPPTPPTAPPSPQSASVAPSPSPNPVPNQRALNEAALAVRRQAYQERLQAQTAAQVAETPPPAAVPAAAANVKLSAAETKAFLDLMQRGMSGPDAMKNVLLQRSLVESLGTPTPTAAQTRFPKGMRGKVTSQP